MHKKWKNWTIPGPMIPVAEGHVHEMAVGSNLSFSDLFSKDSEAFPTEISSDLRNSKITVDSLSGHFRIYQLEKGHRYSTDDLLVAWYGASFSSSVSRVLDLGSGIGSVGMVCAWKLPGAKVISVEAQSVSVALARKSVQLNGLSDRYDVREGDLRALIGEPSSRRTGISERDLEVPSSAPLSPVLDPEEKFDLILGSPPYFPLENGILSEHPQKVSCRFEVRGSILDYAQAAACHLGPSGVFACVFPIEPAHQLERVVHAAKQAGLTILRKRHVHLKEGEPALLGLFLMTLSSDLPESLREVTYTEPPLIIRRKDGTIHPEYSLIKMSIGFAP